jgi:DegV family protein with EDD domain
MPDQKIAIVTDSSAYIPEAVIGNLDVHVIPLWIHWGQDRLRDGVDIQPEEFYKRLRAEDTLPTTSQPSVGEFIEFFKRLAQDFNGIVSIHVTSKLSGTVASATTAMNQFTEIPVKVLDSLSVSMGLGFAVLEAARTAAQGGTLDQVVFKAESILQKLHFLFVLDTLEYLNKGGRISGAKALLGTALRIKPLLHFEDGLIQPLVQVRTKKKGIATMLDKAEERLGGKSMAAVAVVDGDSPEEGDTVAAMVKERFGVEEVIRSGISPAIGIHAGPGAIGLPFYATD